MRWTGSSQEWQESGLWDRHEGVGRFDPTPVGRFQPTRIPCLALLSSALPPQPAATPTSREEAAKRALAAPVLLCSADH